MAYILSEISLLADDIGIIDHGVLLEESSMEELEKKNRKYIQLQVSDTGKNVLGKLFDFGKVEENKFSDHTIDELIKACYAMGRNTCGVRTAFRT